MFDETNRNENNGLSETPENTVPEENAVPVEDTAPIENTVPEENCEPDSYFSAPASLDGSESSVSCNESTPEPTPASEVPVFEPIAENTFAYEPSAVEAPIINEPTVNSYVPEPDPASIPIPAATAYPTEATVSGYEWNAPESAIVYEKETKKKSRESDKGFRAFVIIIISVFLLAIITMCTAVVFHIMSLDNGSDEPIEAPAISTEGTSENFNYNDIIIDTPIEFDEHDGETLSIPEVAAKCTPSSVGIISEVEVSYDFPYYFSPSTYTTEASGSGFIYSSEGYIITNHHVIEEAKKITVVLYDGSEYEAKLVGSDSLSDIAVLKITPAQGITLIPMEIGNSDEVVVGEQVVAIGCPAGIEFIGTVTDGIVSAINRNVELTDDNGRTKKVMTLIQTNATINHGNSGGPLINAKGQVIGINTLKLAQNYEGIGFSIPINGAVAIIEQLIEHGKVIERPDEDYVNARGIIGINGTEITKEEAEYYEIPVGVLVVQIANDSPAAKAGLRRGDIITHYNGTKISSVADINAAKGNAVAGDNATVTVYRIDDNNNGKSFDITFKLMAEE